MESAPRLNEKMIKKTFKNLYKITFPGGEKVIQTPDAAKLVSDTMTKLGQEYSVEAATELLKRYDVGGTGTNRKKQVSNAVLVAAGLDTLDEAEVAELQAKWEKEQLKIKNSTPEAKANRKKMKNLFKGHMSLKLQEHNPTDSDDIPLDKATMIITEVLTGMEVSVEEAQVSELIAQLDSNGSGVMTEKECKMAVQQLSGMKQIDFASHGAKRAKRALKAQKKAMKQKCPQ
jgi:hypothetical protein